MGRRNVPWNRAFTSIMWWEFANDRNWMNLMDRLKGMMKKGEAWPEEKRFR